MTLGFGNKAYGSNVPCDVPGPRDFLAKMTCGECGDTWHARATEEFGGVVFYDDSEWNCPTCGVLAKYFEETDDFWGDVD